MALEKYKIKPEFENEQGVSVYIQNVGIVPIDKSYLTDAMAEQAMMDGSEIFELVNKTSNDSSRESSQADSRKAETGGAIGGTAGSGEAENESKSGDGGDDEGGKKGHKK